MRKKNLHVRLPGCVIQRLSQSHLSFAFAGSEYWVPITAFSRGTRGRLAHSFVGDRYTLEVYPDQLHLLTPFRKAPVDVG